MSRLSSSLPVPAFFPVRFPRFRRPGWPLQTSVEQCIFAASLFFTAFCNGRFWEAVLAGRDWSSAGTWLFASVMVLLLTSIHYLLLGTVITRRTAKPLLGGLFVATALAVHFMNRYTVFFDVSMVRNIFHTDVKESLDLASASAVGTLLMYGLLPALVLCRLEIRSQPIRRALLRRILTLLAAFCIFVVCIALEFQDISSLMRNQKEIRYLVTPAALLVSSARVAAAENAEAAKTRLPVGSDATLGAAWSGRQKPLLLVVVVGETARAANWGLNGYRRQTTPQLAHEDVVNFPDVDSCGSNTEVSLPCMFSPFGRRGYDEKKIRSHESVLHVLEHGGIKTVWRDNQSGCKGVCDKLETDKPGDVKNALHCDGDHCLDEVLLNGLDGVLQKNKRGLVIVMHQIGNHGPAYSQRYPDAYRQFMPTCDTADLRKCSREQIVNSYDNALLYTDQFLSETIRQLRVQQTHDAAMVYVSDHGESLGEHGIFLHGLPYSIAPREQTKVPMVMWFSHGFASGTGLDVECMKANAVRPVSHDNLFHSILGLMQVETTAYDTALDLTSACRA